MSGAEFAVYANGLDRAGRAIDGIESLLGNLRPAMSEAAAATQTNVDLGFRDQSDPYGERWRPLSPLTLILRRKGGAHILKDTGRLANSITTRVDNDGFQVGTNVEYAATHQFGATIRPVRAKYLLAGRPGGPRRRLKQAVIPPRHFLPTIGQGLPADWEQDIVAAVHNHFNQAMAA